MVQIPVDPIDAPIRKIRQIPSLRVDLVVRPKRTVGEPVDLANMDYVTWEVRRYLRRGETRTAESRSLLDALRMVGPRWMCPKAMRRAA